MQALRPASALGPAARYYASTYSWAVFPLHSARNGRCGCARPDCGNIGKHPRTEHGFKNATTDEKQIEMWWALAPDANVGIATGRVSGIVVVDVDPRNGGDGALDDLLTDNGPFPETVESLTGGGGRHIVFRYPADIEGRLPSGKLAGSSGIDIKADGGYIVAPPSVHQSTRSYAWEASSRPGEVPFADLPPWLLARILESRKADAPPPGQPGELERSFLYRAFSAAGWLGKTIDPTRIAVRCPWAASHTTGSDGDTSTVLFAPAPGKSRGWFYCSHSHCGERAPEDVLRALPPEAVAQAKRQENAYQPPTPPPAATTDAPVDPDAWKADLSRTPGGAIKNTYGNICLILRHTYGPRLTYNAMRLSPILSDVPLVDADIGKVREDLERKWGITPSKDNTGEAVRQVAAERSFHPVQGYLSSLHWDGVTRIHRLIRCWFVSAVARALRPGCKVDTAFVLVGRQGFLKSTFFSVLGGEWFSDTAMDISNKDSLLQLAFAWIYEWPELENITSKKQASEVKAFTTSKADTFRPPFGRGVIQHPRSTVIVGTTNEDEFLVDPTGSRRFWIVRVTKRINTTLLAEWRDQLWAEALADFESNATWWLEQEEEEGRESAAEEYHLDDAILSSIANWLRGPEALRLIAERVTALDPGSVTVGDVLLGALKLEPGKWGRSEQTRVGAALSRLRWRKVRPLISGVRMRAYVPPREVPNGD
jgi:hypothetical protein